MVMKLSVLLAVLSLLTSACIGGTDFSGAYVETIPEDGLDDGRLRALRVIVHEYNSAVGGYVEFYEIGDINDRFAPWSQVHACAYYGDLRQVGDAVPAVIVHPELGELRMQISRRNRRRMSAVVSAGGEILGVEDGSELEFEGDDLPEGRVCPEVTP